jgi:pimeloyl-ACP methyl ester carboxylesterase
MFITRMAAAAAALIAVSGLTAPVANADSTRLGRFYHQRLTWKGCQRAADDPAGKELDAAGAQCADLTVPLDYADPSGPTITVAISRLKATDTRHRIGAMLLNGGGPGGQGVDMPLAVKDTMGDVGQRYDLIGMDPRFVARSTPLDCGWPTGSFIRSAGLDHAGFDQTVAFERDLAVRCERRNAAVLPYVTSRNTARDMDVIRGALGERRISYFAWSYGTYLGAVYTQMFPGRTDRVVLDSAVDPRRYSPRLLMGTEAANEAALTGWAAWAAGHDGTYSLGTTRSQVLATVRHIVRVAADRPLKVGTYRVDEHVVPVLLYNGLGDDRDPTRAFLATVVKTLKEAAAGRPADPTEEVADLLRFMLTGSAPVSGSLQSSSQYGSVQTSIICGDVVAPRDPTVYWHDIQARRKNAPDFAPVTNNVGPCAFWQPPREQPTQVGNNVPVLIVAATGDTRTIYAFSQGLHQVMTGSRLLTLRDAAVHAVYANYGNACVDHDVNAYLASGTLPAHDITCTN